MERAKSPGPREIRVIYVVHLDPTVASLLLLFWFLSGHLRGVACVLSWVEISYFLLTYQGPSRSDGNGRGPGALCPAAHVIRLDFRICGYQLSKEYKLSGFLKPSG